MKKFAAAILAVLFLSAPACAMQWRELHEEADSMSPEEALQAAEADPACAGCLYKLGLVYLDLHEDTLAYGAFSSVLLLEPESIEARWGKAEVLRRRHDLETAEKMLKQIIKEEPRFSPAYITLAYIKYIQMDFEQSVRLALKVIQQGRKNVDLSNYVRAYSLYAGAKGMIAHYGGPLSKAINGTAVKPNLDKAQSLKPDTAGVLFGLGSYYLLAPGLAGGDKNKAEEYLKKAVEVDPLLADAYVRLAQLYNSRGERAKYDFYLNKALQIDPASELALDTKSRRCKYICAGDN